MSSSKKDPKQFKLKVKEDGTITLEVDTMKTLCDEPPHIHLYVNGRPNGQISLKTYEWTMPPIGVAPVYKRIALRLVSENHNEILNAYNHNKKYGSEQFTKIGL